VIDLNTDSGIHNEPAEKLNSLISIAPSDVPLCIPLAIKIPPKLDRSLEIIIVDYSE